MRDIYTTRLRFVGGGERHQVVFEDTEYIPHGMDYYEHPTLPSGSYKAELMVGGVLQDKTVFSVWE